MPSCRGFDSIESRGLDRWQDESEENVKRKIKTNFLNGMHDTWHHSGRMMMAWVE